MTDSEKKTDLIFKSHNLILYIIFQEKQLGISLIAVLSWPKSLRTMVASLISCANLDKCLSFLTRKMEIVIVPTDAVVVRIK